MHRRLYSLLVATALLTLGCGEDEADSNAQPPDPNAPRVHGLTEQQAAQTLAKIGDTTITLGDFAGELASKGSFIRTRYNSPERRREFLDQMIRFELLAREAERRGYDELPAVQRAEKQMMIRRFLEQRFEQGGPEDIPEADVRAYYEAHQSEFHTPRQVRASHIQIRDRATAQRVLTQIQAAPNDLRLFRQLAEQHNIDPETKDRFGDLRFFSQPSERTANEPEIPTAIAEAAFAIERIGGIAPELVRTEGGYHIVKLTGRRAPMHRSLEEAERPIRSRLHRQRREEGIQALIAELRAEEDVEEHLDVLADIQLDLPEGGSPTVTHPQLQGPITVPTKAPAERPAGQEAP